MRRRHETLFAFLATVVYAAFGAYAARAGVVVGLRPELDGWDLATAAFCVLFAVFFGVLALVSARRWRAARRHGDVSESV